MAPAGRHQRRARLWRGWGVEVFYEEFAGKNHWWDTFEWAKMYGELPRTASREENPMSWTRSCVVCYVLFTWAVPELTLQVLVEKCIHDVILVCVGFCFFFGVGMGFKDSDQKSKKFQLAILILFLERYAILTLHLTEYISAETPSQLYVAKTHGWKLKSIQRRINRNAFIVKDQ